MFKTEPVSHSKALGHEALGVSLRKVCVYCGKRLTASMRRGKPMGRGHQCDEMTASRKPSAPIPFS